MNSFAEVEIPITAKPFATSERRRGGLNLDHIGTIAPACAASQLREPAGADLALGTWHPLGPEEPQGEELLPETSGGISEKKSETPP